MTPQPPPAWPEQVAVISGGLGDIGRAISHTLCVEGARVSLGDFSPATAAGVARSNTLIPQSLV